MKDATKLERLINREFIYKQENIRVKDWFSVPEEGKINIITDKGPISIKDTEVQQFVDKCLPVEQEAPLAVVSEASQTITNLKDILLDNIKKVQENKDYIAQANTINNSVNSLLNMVSLQIKINNRR